MSQKQLSLGADGVLLASGVVKAKNKEEVLRDLACRYPVISYASFNCLIAVW